MESGAKKERLPAEPKVPHLSRRQMRAWRGFLEARAVLLPALEADLRNRTRLSLSEFDVLYQLWRMPERTLRMTDLARAVLVTPSGVTRIVSRLERRGIVERNSASGRQAVATRLTALGEKELQAAMEVHFAGVHRLFIRHLTSSDVDRLDELWELIASTCPQ
jgi:DNA-binding MarR family transcriptional regulator